MYQKSLPSYFSLNYSSQINTHEFILSIAFLKEIISDTIFSNQIESEILLGKIVFNECVDKQLVNEVIHHK